MWVDIISGESISAMLLKGRFRFGSKRSTIVKGIAGLGPNTDSRTPTDRPLMMAACDGYSGCIGVSLSGIQPGSRSVASLLSMSALRIAVTGRQKLYVNLASQSVMKVLAMPTLSSANRRAFSARPSPFAADIWRAATSQLRGRFDWVQYFTASVWAAVRVVLLAPPTVFVSL